MAVQKEIETVCPLCEEAITLVDFDPEDKSDDTGQDIECPECGETFDDWTLNEDGSLTILCELADDLDAEDETEESGSEEDEEEA